MISSTQDIADGQHAARVLIVDDHNMFAELLGVALGNSSEFQCVGTAQTGAQALDLAVRHHPDLVLMDIQLRRESGLDTTRKIRDVLPAVVVVVLSAHREPQWVARAARAGASAFAPKNGSLSEILTVLRTAHNGHMMVAPSVYGRPADDRDDGCGPVIDSLTAREHQVLVLMGKGMVPTAMALLLGISLNTCRGYVKSIHSKLSVQSQLEAVVTAQRLGIIDACDES
jgi:DNA-binding NarL/FixJ family response regulator